MQMRLMPISMPPDGGLCIDGLHVVDEHLGGDIYVGAFLFGFPHDCMRNLIFQKGKDQTFARPCTALSRLSSRLSTHQGVRHSLYQIALREAKG